MRIAFFLSARLPLTGWHSDHLTGERNVLKKAGILVAATAAGLLAVSPLAFAGDKGDDWGYGGSDGDRQVNRVDSDRELEQAGLVNVGDVQVIDDANVCPSIPVAAGIGNILGILGTGAADADADADEVTCVNDESINQNNFDD
jgi:hypothetical protein